jgi:hypothetical protein
MYSKLTPIRPRVLTPWGDSFDDPFGWTDKCTSGTGPVLVELEIDEVEYYAKPMYFAVSLVADTQYTIKGVNASSGSPNARIDLYDAAGTKVAYNTGSWDDEWTEYTVTDLVYTPTESGEYIFAVLDGDEMGMGSSVEYNLYVSPRPETLSKAGPTPYETSAGAISTGMRDYQRVSSDAHLVPFDLWDLYFKLGLDWDDFLRWLKKHYYYYYVYFIRLLACAPLRDHQTKDVLGNNISYVDYGGTSWETKEINGCNVLHAANAGYDRPSISISPKRSISSLNSFYLTFLFWFHFDPTYRREGNWDGYWINIFHDVINYTGVPGTNYTYKPPTFKAFNTEYPITLAKDKLHRIQITKTETGKLRVYLNDITICDKDYVSGYNQYFNSLVFHYDTVYPDQQQEPKRGQGATRVFFNGKDRELKIWRI